MKDHLKLSEKALQRIEDHLERMEAQLEQRAKGLENRAIKSIGIAMGVVLLILVYMLFCVWDKL
jgi:hypothetical protein